MGLGSFGGIYLHGRNDEVLLLDKIQDLIETSHAIA